MYICCALVGLDNKLNNELVEGSFIVSSSQVSDIILRLSADWMMILENRILKTSKINYVTVHIREQLKHMGRNCAATYIQYEAGFIYVMLVQ